MLPPDCVCCLAGKAASKANLKGPDKGLDLDVKPSAPTSVPLRVRFGTGSPVGTVVNPMFAQDGTAPRYPLLFLSCLFLLFCLLSANLFFTCIWLWAWTWTCT